MDNDGNRTGLDYLADLWAGRIHNTFQTLVDNQRILLGRIEQQQQEINTMTANEQKIIDAAQTLTGAVGTISQGIQTLKDQNEAMRQQIIDLGQQPPPEDLSQEFADFDAAMGQVKGLADGLRPAPAGTPADGSESGNTSGDVTGAPITQPADESPLAGESGTTNPVVEGGGPMIEPQAPGQPIDLGSQPVDPATGEPSAEPETVPAEESAPNPVVPTDTSTEEGEAEEGNQNNPENNPFA